VPDGGRIMPSFQETPMKRLLMSVLIAGTALMAAPSTARADGYLSPYVGVNFGGDTTKNSSVYGGSLGYLGHSAGFEVDFGYTPNFFGSDTLDVDGKVSTLMGNLLIGGRHAGFSPYLALGAGLLRTDVSGVVDVFDVSETKNNWGGNFGGGAFIGGGSITVRGDVRYFKSFDTSGDFPQITGNKLGFWRATVGVGLMW
jgi:Outer membrane protein beta-barrel domain